jgi:hypothetical protein
MNPTLLPGMTRRLTYKEPQNKTVRFLRPEATHMVFARLTLSTWFKTRVVAEAKTAWQEIA